MILSDVVGVHLTTAYSSLGYTIFGTLRLRRGRPVAKEGAHRNCFYFSVMGDPLVALWDFLRQWIGSLPEQYTQARHPAYYALSINGAAMFGFGAILLCLPRVVLRQSGFQKAMEPPLVLMHRITGIWVMLAGAASVPSRPRPPCGPSLVASPLRRSIPPREWPMAAGVDRQL
jgi:hypothetical protein